MGIFIPSRMRKHRRFDYEPRYYDPSRDRKLKERIRIKSKARRRRGTSGIVYFLLLLSLAIFAYLQFP